MVIEQVSLGISDHTVHHIEEWGANVSSKNSLGNQQSSYRLDDRVLIEWLKNHQRDIVFTAKLAYEVHGRTEKLGEAIDKLNSDEDLYQQKDEVAEIWRDLLGKAIVYLKSKDTREKYHDDEDYGVEKLDDFFKTFREFESLLYGAEEERYRDHMAHMLSVFLVGEFLIRETIGFDKIDVGDEGLPEDKKISVSEKEAMWCIMSLTHDLGIALERIVDISPKAKRMLEKFGIVNMQELSYPFLRLPLHDFAIRFISSDLEAPASNEETRLPHIQSKYVLKFSEAYESRDHGIISCLVLMKNLVYFLETDYSLDLQRPLNLYDAKQFLIRRNILRAIAAHNNENIYYLTLPQFPFLLTIFDELHEWGRPRLIEIFEKGKLETFVTVESLSETAISYKIALHCTATLGDEEKKLMKKEICRRFIRKCEKIKRILRSAVGGQFRNLVLTLEVSDELEAKALPYKIIHETPENVRVLVDNQEVTWLELLERLKS